MAQKQLNSVLHLLNEIYTLISSRYRTASLFTGKKRLIVLISIYLPQKLLEISQKYDDVI